MEPWPTLSASSESCSMRWVSPHPCIAVSESVFRMRRSSVPWRTCSLAMGLATTFPPECREEGRLSPPECQEDGGLGRGTRPSVSASWSSGSAACRLDRRDVDLLHLHHRIEGALGNSRIGIRDRLRQGDRGNLPGQAPSVFTPAARTLLAAVADDRVPIAVRFGLVDGGDLKRERFVVFEGRTTVQPEARNAHHRKLDGQHITFLPRRKVPRCAVDCLDGRIREGLGVESSCVLSVAIIPEANRVL